MALFRCYRPHWSVHRMSQKEIETEMTSSSLVTTEIEGEVETIALRDTAILCIQKYCILAYIVQIC